MAEQEEKPVEAAWAHAYLQQSHNAAVGRLFRGLIHNLNGALQAFSLQTDILAMANEQVQGIMEKMLAADMPSEAQAFVRQLSDLLQRRASALHQMQEKVRSCEQTVQRTLILPDFAQMMGTEPYTVNSIIRVEVEFLCADSFFKHKVGKDLQLATDLPPLSGGQLAIHQILFFLLENSLAAVRGSDQPRIVVRSSRDAGMTTVLVEDNGPGVPEMERERIFAPFYSTWNEHLGLGLYLARGLAAELQGALVCEAGTAGAAFRLTLPTA